MTTGLLVLLLTTTAPTADTSTPEHHAVLAHAAIAVFMIGQFTDITTTEYGIGAGKITEANPLFRWAVSSPVKAGAAKGAFAVGVSAILLKLHHRHGIPATVMAITLAGAQGAITWHNSRFLREP